MSQDNINQRLEEHSKEIHKLDKQLALITLQNESLQKDTSGIQSDVKELNKNMNELVKELTYKSTKTEGMLSKHWVFICSAGALATIFLDQFITKVFK